MNNLSEYNPEFNLTAWFGAAPKNADGTQAQRYIVGTLSDMFIKLGEYPGKEYSVTYPDGTIEYHDAGDVIELGDNNFDKPDVMVSTVTFKYQDNVTPDTLGYVRKTYLPNGWLVNDDAYADSTSFTVEKDTVINYNFIETTVGPTFDTPTREGYTFNGWYTDSENGSLVESYTSDEDITLYAHWTQTDINIIIPDEPDPIIIPVTPGEPYNLPENNKAKDSENVGSVTFKYNDNETDDLTKYVVASYVPNGWLINNVHYDDGTEITPTEDTTLVRDYIETVTGIDWPADPTRDNFEFNGWYTDAELEHEYTLRTYSEKADIDLFAKWTEMVTIDPPGSDPIVVPKGTEVTLPTNNNSKANENVAEVTFKPENGEEDIVRYVQRQFTPSGWLIDGVHYDDGATYTANESITPEADYTYVTVPVTFPDDPTYENHSFDGWFDSQTGGSLVTSYDEEIDTTIYAQWSYTLPTAISVESNAIILVKGEEEQIVVTTTPPNLQNIDYTYTVEEGSENIVSVSSDGLITALNPGTANITIAVTNDPTVYTTINVTVINNKITSQVYDVVNKDRTGEDIRIVIGSEPEITVSEYLENIDNDIEYIKVYDKDNNLINADDYDDTLATTGMVLKLVIADVEHDSVIVVIRGDIDQDGYVDVSDGLKLQNHTLRKEYLEGYLLYAADLDEDPTVPLEDMIDVTDGYQLDMYVLRKIPSLNEKDGD